MKTTTSDMMQMVTDLRARRQHVTPKNQTNREYLEYCVAISALQWLIRNEMKSEVQ